MRRRDGSQRAGRVADAALHDVALALAALVAGAAIAAGVDHAGTAGAQPVTAVAVGAVVAQLPAAADAADAVGAVAERRAAAQIDARRLQRHSGLAPVARRAGLDGVADAHDVEPGGAAPLG